jgi:hypothetical protein
VNAGDEHLTLEQLSDRRSDLLGADDTRDVDDHLTDCVPCRGRLAALDAVTEGLAGVPPVAMPSDVTERITAALAAERGLRPTVVPLQAPPDQRRRRFTYAGAAAAAAVVALVTAVFVGHASPSTGRAVTAGNAATGGVTGSTADVQRLERVVHHSGTRYTSTNLTDRLAASLSTSEPSISPGPDEAAESPAATAMSTQSRSTQSPGSRATAAVPTALTALTAPARLLACVQQVAGAAVVPVTVDLSTYDGHPAAVIVLPSDASDATAYVVGPKCGLPAEAGTADIQRYVEVPLS